MKENEVTLKSILKKYMQVCNCENDDIWHIDEQDFDLAVSAIKKLMMEIIGRDRDIGEMRYCGCNPDEDRGYNKAKAEVREEVGGL